MLKISWASLWSSRESLEANELRTKGVWGRRLTMCTAHAHCTWRSHWNWEVGRSLDTPLHFLLITWLRLLLAGLKILTLLTLYSHDSSSFCCSLAKHGLLVDSYVHFMNLHLNNWSSPDKLWWLVSFHIYDNSLKFVLHKHKQFPDNSLDCYISCFPEECFIPHA